MANNNVRALKSGIWYTLSNFLVRSIGFITIPIFARVLSKSEYGQYNNYTSWLSIITIFITFNLEATLISARYDYEDEFDKYILSMLSLSSVSAIIWIIVVNIFHDFFSDFFGLSPFYINIMIVYLLMSPAVHLFQARERYYFEYKKTVFTSVILTVGTTFLSVLLVLVMQNKLDGRIIGAVIPTIILGIYFWLFFLKRGEKITFQYWKYALLISLPYIPHTLSLTFLNSTDRVMISRWCGAEATAMYSIAYNCGLIITMLLGSVNSAYAPWLGERLACKDYKAINLFSKKYILGFEIVAIGIMLIAPEILLILGGETYIEAKYVITPVAMGCICQFLYTMFVNVEQFSKKTLGMAIATTIAAFINLGLNYLFIPKVGYMAAAYTTLVGYICLLFMHMYLVNKIGLKEVYPYMFILVDVSICCIITILITLLYNLNVVRYVIICGYIMMLVFLGWKYKEWVIRLIKRILIRR